MAGERKRGRPKGTGINDHEMLLKIAHILIADPGKKRTTAIKEIGISKPSVVRRLRDKYQEQEEILLAEVHSSTRLPRKAAPAVAQVAPAAAQPLNGQAAMFGKKGKTASGQTASPAAAPVASHLAAQVKEEPITAGSKTAAAAGANPAIDPLAALFEGLSIESLVSQFIGHVLGLDANEIKNSPIPALIRQQAQLADLVLPLLASQFMAQKSVKAA